MFAAARTALRRSGDVRANGRGSHRPIALSAWRGGDNPVNAGRDQDGPHDGYDCGGADPNSPEHTVLLPPGPLATRQSVPRLRNKRYET